MYDCPVFVAKYVTFFYFVSDKHVYEVTNTQGTSSGGTGKTVVFGGQLHAELNSVSFNAIADKGIRRILLWFNVPGYGFNQQYLLLPERHHALTYGT